jgi:hypothetical protein
MVKIKILGAKWWLFLPSGGQADQCRPAVADSFLAKIRIAEKCQWKERCG